MLSSCTYLLVEVGSELCSLDLPLGWGVDVGTGVVVPDPTGVCGGASPIGGMELNLIRLNPICQVVDVPESGLCLLTVGPGLFLHQKFIVNYLHLLVHYVCITSSCTQDNFNTIFKFFLSWYIPG